MAVSKTKKRRLKLEREGKHNPEELRGSWHGVHPVTRTTPGLREKAERLHKKHKRNQALRSDDSFCAFYGDRYKTGYLARVCSIKLLHCAICSSFASSMMM